MRPYGKAVWLQTLPCPSGNLPTETDLGTWLEGAAGCRSCDLPKLYTVQTSIPETLLSSCLASSSEKRPSLLKNDFSSSFRKITFSRLEKKKALYLKWHIS